MNYDPRRTLELTGSEPPLTPPLKDSRLSVFPEKPYATQNSPTQAIVNEFQYQVELNRQGSTFIFQLYTDPFSLTKQVSLTQLFWLKSEL